MTRDEHFIDADFGYTRRCINYRCDPRLVAETPEWPNYSKKRDRNRELTLYRTRVGDRVLSVEAGDYRGSELWALSVLDGDARYLRKIQSNRGGKSGGNRRT